MIERDQALDILDELKANLPNDIRMAKDIVQKRNDVLASGKREADAIKKQAEESAKQMVRENEIVLEARKKAGDIVRVAENRSKELKKATTEYCEDNMKRAEEAIASLLDEMRKSRQQFHALATKQVTVEPTPKE